MSAPMRSSRFLPFPDLRARLAPVAASLLGLWLAGCAAALNAATSTDGYERITDLRYQAGERGTYDLYVPDDARGPRASNG